jgi:hypothetical protein
MYGEADVYLHTYLTSALESVSSFRLHSVCSRRKNPYYTMGRGLREFQSWIAHSGDEKLSFFCGNSNPEPSTIQPQPVAIPERPSRYQIIHDFFLHE